MHVLSHPKMLFGKQHTASDWGMKMTSIKLTEPLILTPSEFCNFYLHCVFWTQTGSFNALLPWSKLSMCSAQQKTWIGKNGATDNLIKQWIRSLCNVDTIWLDFSSNFERRQEKDVFFNQLCSVFIDADGLQCLELQLSAFSKQFFSQIDVSFCVGSKAHLVM